MIDRKPRNEPRSTGASPTSAVPTSTPGRGGLPVPPGVRARFGTDLSSVQVSTNAPGPRALGASAIAIGDHVQFAGRAPSTRTIAHELVHVVQARAHPGAAPRALSRPYDAAEREAERVADNVARGGTAGPIVEAPAGRVQRDGNDPVCEEPNVGSFVLDPALADVETPALMTTHVRLAPSITSGEVGDRFVVLERPVRAARRFDVYAVPRWQTYVTPEEAATPRSMLELDLPQFLDGDVVYTPTGQANMVATTDELVFVDEALDETIGAATAVLLTTDAGYVLLDAGMQLTSTWVAPEVGAQLGREIAAVVDLTPLSEAVLVAGAPSGHALPYIAGYVGIGAIRATRDQLDDGTVAAVLQTQRAYRDWYEETLRARLTEGRAATGRLTRTEYIRMRDSIRVDRAFHGVGRVLGAVMVIHSIEGLAPGVTQEGEINIPESALRLAHSALGMSIGVRMASTTFREAMAGTGASGLRNAGEMAAMVILEFGMAATADYASSEERDAALLNTAISALCMIVGQGIMSAGAYIPHPIGRGVVMGLGLAVMLFGERALRFFGLDEAVERATSFLPGPIWDVQHRIDAMLREYRLMIGAAALGERSDEDLRARGATDVEELRTDALDVEVDAQIRAGEIEMGLTTLFENGYRTAQGSFVGLQYLDQQAAEFHRLRQLAEHRHIDLNREEIERRWREMDASLDLSGASASVIDGMGQWSKLSELLDDLESRLGDDDVNDMLETLQELNLVFENARYRISSENRGDYRPAAIIPAGTDAYDAYVARLRPFEQRLASLQRRVVWWSGGTSTPAMYAAADDAAAMSPLSAHDRLIGTRQSYDALVASLHADYPRLAETELWENPAAFIRAVEDANRAEPNRFRLLHVAELGLRSATQQAEIAVAIADTDVPEAFRQLVAADAESARQAIHARKYTYGLVFMSERQAMIDERVAEHDPVIASTIDAAFPSEGRTETTGLSSEEELALTTGWLGESGGSGHEIRTTTSLLEEYRRRMVGHGTLDSDADLLNPDTWNFAVAPQFFRLEGGFRYVDWDWLDTYPWQDIQSGRTPLVAGVFDTAWGTHTEYGLDLQGPARYYQVIAVNRDAVLTIGTSPRYIRVDDLHGIDEAGMRAMIEERGGSTTSP